MTHPGQFTRFASRRDDVVDTSVRDLRTPITPTSPTYSSEDCSIARGREPPAIKPDSVRGPFNIPSVSSREQYVRQSTLDAVAPATSAPRLWLVRQMHTRPTASKPSPPRLYLTRPKRRPSTSAWSSLGARSPRATPACVHPSWIATCVQELTSLLALQRTYGRGGAGNAAKSPSSSKSKSRSTSRLRSRPRSISVGPFHLPGRSGSGNASDGLVEWGERSRRASVLSSESR